MGKTSGFARLDAGRHRLVVAAAVGACVTALAAGQLTADAAPGPAQQHPEQTAARQPGVAGTDHAMGSQIELHEGMSGSSKPRGLATQSLGTETARTPGMDVSHWQGRVDWKRARARGARFAYVKATEGTDYRDPTFNYQYRGSARAGMLRGAYHFALPHVSTGTAQANYFVRHGGGWTRDGRTLPGALDIEYNPYGKTCYAKTHRQMARWIIGFSRQYHRLTHRWPVIYTSTSWWQRCVGRVHSFDGTSPLWIARYNDHIGALPFRWGTHTIWQHNNSGRFPGDQNRFNGSFARVRALARG